MNWDAPTLKTECEAADAFRDKILESLPKRMDRYTGTSFGYTKGEYWPENYYFTWVSYVLPQVLARSPSVKIGSLKMSEVAADAKGLELGVKRWIRDVDYYAHIRRMGFDLGFSYGISYTRPMPMPQVAGSDVDKVWYRPEVMAVNQHLYGLDPLSDGPKNARYQYHVVVQDKDDLLQWAKDHPEEGWNKRAIEAAGTVDPITLTKSEAKEVPDRTQTAYRIIWCPEEDSRDEEDKKSSPDDYNGTIYTLALFPSSDRETEFLREPYPFMGPRWGPYTMWGAYPVPGCPYPLASLTAVDAQLKEVNATALANYKSGRRRKKIGIFDKTVSGEAEAIAACEDGGTVGITGFDKTKFVEAEFGGVTEVGLAQEEAARQMADRATGINDVMRGQVSTGALATEVMQAAGASNVRTADMENQCTRGSRQELTTVAWYMWRYDSVRQPLTMEDREQLGQQDPETAAVMANLPPEATVYFQGGEENRASFDSLELTIEPYSMRRTDEPMMQQRAMQALELATQLAPVIPQAPFIRWKVLLDKFGDAMNWPEFSDILDEKLAAQYAALMLQSQQPVEPSKGPSGPGPQPRLGGDVQAPQQSFGNKNGATKSAGKTPSKMAGASK